MRRSEFRQAINTSPGTSATRDYFAPQLAACDELYSAHRRTGGVVLALGAVLIGLGFTVLVRRGRKVYVDPRVLIPLPPPPSDSEVDLTPLCIRCGRPRPARPTSTFGALDTANSLCNVCVAARRMHSTVIAIGLSLGFIVAGLILNAAGFTDPGNWVLAAGLLSPLLYLQIAPHELGHALVGRTLGLAVLQVNVGTRSRLTAFSIGRCRVEVRALPTSGSTALLCLTEHGYRLRMWLSVAAGPAVSIAIIAIVLSLGGNPTGNLAVLRWMAVASAAWIVVVNLIPRQVRGGTVATHTDGWLLIRTPKSTEVDVENQVAVNRALLAVELARRSGDDLELNESDRGLLRRAVERGDESAAFAETYVLMGDRRWREAADTIRDAVQAAPAHEYRYAILRNNLAWCRLLEGDAAVDSEADRASEEAYALLPQEPALAGTRGSVLVELGQYNEGIQLLRTSIANHVDATSRALNYCYLAIGEAGISNLDDARSSLRTAEQLDPNCDLLERAASRLAEATP